MAKRRVEVKAHRRKDGSLVQGHTREVEASQAEARASEIRGTLGVPVDTTAVPDMPSLPEGWEEWKPVKDGTVPQSASAESMMTVSKLIGNGATSAEIAENQKHTDSRSTNYTTSGLIYMGLAYREGRKIHLTGYGKDFAEMSPDEQRTTLGNMLANTDDVWLSHMEREKAWKAQGHELRGQTLNERNENFDNWRKLAEEAVRDNADSQEEAERFIDERKRHAEANARVHSPVGKKGRRGKDDPFFRQDNEIHCQRCFMLTVPGRPCPADNPSCTNN